MLAFGFGVEKDKKMYIATNKGIVVVKLDDIPRPIHKARLSSASGEKYSSMVSRSLSSPIGIFKPVGQHTSGRLFSVEAYEEFVSITSDEGRIVYLDGNQSKIVVSVNSVCFMASYNTVQFLSDPLTTKPKEVNFTFDFMIQDFTPFKSNICIAVSRHGWVGVLHENKSGDVVHSSSF